MDSVKILVVDDDVQIARAIETLLKREGYEVVLAHDGLQALDVVAQETVHLIVMDVMMPRLDGLSAMLKIRERKNIPILILSAKSEESDKVLGLGMGADDYVTKPYNPQELLARVKSQLRRYLELGAHNQVGKDGVFVNGGLMLDSNTMTFTVDGEPVKLTAKEFGIMAFLMAHPGVVFSAERIYEHVWEDVAYSVENTVMVHIRRIREKIEINPKDPKYLKVVWGIGYKIEKF